jgi:hypothetical protein
MPSSATRGDLERETRIKDSILHAVCGETLPVPEPARLVVKYEKPGIKEVRMLQGFRGLSIGASLGALAACLVFAFILEQGHALNGRPPAAVTDVATVPVVSVLSSHVSEAQNRDQELLRTKLTNLEVDRSRLERLFQESQIQNSTLQNSSAQEQEQVAALSKELESARLAEAQALQKLEQLNLERKGDQTAIAAQNREIRSLNERLENQTLSEDRNQNVVQAENDLRELVGSRNLHIVDVYDTDSKGKTKPAVGRVFYTEGKSLVFYAYDLSHGHADSGTAAYYVWGNKDGNLETVRNLGTLGTDDKLQRRWKLQVNDANVLADIDRVFVTVEPAGKLGPRPHGKKILSAYLGGPVNHP